MKNKCDELNIDHAWRSTPEMYGFQMLHKEKCANCDLTRTKYTTITQWWSYSDDRPNEPIDDIKAV